MRKIWRLSCWFMGVILMVWLVALLYFGYAVYRMPMQQQGLFYLPPQSSAYTLSQRLYRQKLIQHPLLFRLLLRTRRMASKLQPGTYRLDPQASVWDLVIKMVTGDVYKVPLKIIEGTRLCDLILKMQHATDYRFDPQWLSQISNAYPSLEGLFYPSTYYQPYGESVLPVLKLAYQMMQQQLLRIWETRAQGLPYHNAYELLIAASIIEKETADEAERKLISGVIVNRLQAHMPLQMDPTVAYGISQCQHILVKGSDLKYDSLYNTYRHQGLPPTPIAIVSHSSLMAAAHPEDTDYLYFVAKGNGFHEFSKYYVDQQKAVRQYLRKTHD